MGYRVAMAGGKFVVSRAARNAGKKLLHPAWSCPLWPNREPESAAELLEFIQQALLELQPNTPASDKDEVAENAFPLLRDTWWLLRRLAGRQEWNDVPELPRADAEILQVEGPPITSYRYLTALDALAKLQNYLATKTSERFPLDEILKRVFKTNQLEDDIISVLVGEEPLKGEVIAAKLGRNYDGNLKGHLGGLTRRGILDNLDPNYCLSDLYRHFLNKSGPSQD